MNRTSPQRLLWLLWLALVALFIANALFPRSNFLTRSTGTALFCGVWLGLLGLCWRGRVARFSLLAITLLGAVFLLLPARSLPPTSTLRSDYTDGLRRYEGARYFWGGESPKGIDCSGLIRRGLIDALFWRGIRTADSGLVRRSLDLWWHDCSAADLGEAHPGLTVRLLDTTGINQLDTAQILPGDLAVTRSGIHIMAYLGDGQWIEADPILGRVITVSAPAKNNPWFETPMKMVRWELLSASPLPHDSTKTPPAAP